MNYNPFAKNSVRKRMFSSHYVSLSIFDRIVGRPDTMGILDYALVFLPFFNKLALQAAKKNHSKAGEVITKIISVPLAAVKLALYAVTSPIHVSLWGIRNAIKNKKAKNKISPHTAGINALLVRAPANMHQDPDSMPVVPLSEVNKLHDNDLSSYSIKANNFGEIILTTFPGNTTVATFVPTRKNIIAMQKLIIPHLSAVDYFVSNAGKTIFNYSATKRIDEISAQQAANMTNLVHKLLVASTIPAQEKQSSFTQIPSEVRRMIAKRVLLNDIELTPKHKKSMFFASFKPEEREAAVLQYVSANKIR